MISAHFVIWIARTTAEQMSKIIQFCFFSVYLHLFVKFY